MKVHTLTCWIILLVVIDQVIKIFINHYFLDTQFEIIPSLLEFRPVFNDKYSYINDILYRRYQVNMGLWLHLILFFCIEVIVLIYYDFFKRLSRSRLLDVALIFQLSGMICALIGNLIWKNGVLDYIYLKPLFIFDLKDLYNNCFLILFLIYSWKNRVLLHSIKVKDVFSHIKNKKS